MRGLDGFREAELARGPTSVFKASCHCVFLRVIGDPQGWMAGVGWMGNPEPLAPQGYM